MAENPTGATAVVHGTVTDTGGGALTVRVDRVFKGQVGVGIRVFVGPSRGGGVATSVDYRATAGSDHTLYLIGGTDGQLETDACLGSHAGQANPEELAYFGAGTVPTAGSSPDNAAGRDVTAPPSEVAPIWAAAVVAGAAGLAVLVWRRRNLRFGR